MNSWRWLLLLILVIGAGLVWLPEKRMGTPQETKELRPEFPVQAFAFRVSQRLSENGEIPENALWRAKLERDALVDPGDGGGIGPSSWVWLGPGNIGGRTRPVVFHPNNPNIIYIGTASGGIWKTTNGGAWWVPLADFMPTLAVATLVIRPDQPSVLYAGTGEGFFTNDYGIQNTSALTGAGIFKSADGGETWEQIPSTAGPDWTSVNRLALSPTNPNIMLAATGTGIYRSTNGGDTWTRVHTVRTLDVKFHPTDGNRAVAGRADGVALYSTNGGVSWTQASGISGTRVELAYAPSNPNIVYAAVAESGRIRVYRSTNGGQSYTLQTSGNGISTLSIYTGAIWVDPTNPDHILVAGVSCYRSTNAGVSLSQVFSSVHSDFHSIVHHPAFDGVNNKTVYFATDGGMYRTTDVYGTSATSLNNNLGATQFYGAAIHAGTNVVMGGTQDNYTLLYTGNPQGWSIVRGGDGGFCASDPTDPNVFYGEVQRGLIFRRTGSTVTNIYSGISDAGNANTINFIPHFILDPNNPNRMLVAAERLWRTNNAKTGNPPSWTAIKASIRPPGPEPPPGPPGDHFTIESPYNISTIAVAEGNSDIIWVGYNNGEVWKTTNGTAGTPTWTRVDNNTPGLPDRWVSRIVIDRNNHNRVYVAFMGFEPNNLWRTTDGGNTWQQITGTGSRTLPRVPCSALAIHRVIPGRIYVGTDIGLFTSDDDGQTWSAHTQGPGTAPIEELVWRDDNTLMAVTHGRGVYLGTVSTEEDPVSPFVFTIERGLLLQGNLQHVVWSDDQHLVVRPWFVLSQAEPPVRIVFRGSSPRTNPPELRFRIEAHASVGGLLQSVQLFNYQTNGWETVDTRPATTADSVAEIVVNTNASRFVHPTTLEMQARIAYIAGGPILVYPWQVRIDQILWRVRY
jgi:photosystem II stability/assembly factor-like uncharacterized protein